MNEYHYRLVGKALTYIGMMILLSPFFPFLPSYVVSDILTYTGFLFLGFIMACSGVIIHRRFREMMPFLTKSGESIHSGKTWKKGSESGLFLTSCERVVSINPESRETTDVGYRLVSAEGSTCRGCNMRAGRILLEGSGKRRSY
jgi:hypothetical protein